MSARLRLPLVLASLALLRPAATARADRDPLPDTRSRLALEAQRVEKRFADDRATAYRLVRADAGKLEEAADILYAVLAMLEKDRSLSSGRRAVLIVTIKADVKRIARIAGDRR